MAIHSDTRVARRYAAALFESVSKDGPDGIDGAAADLTVVEEMLKNVPYLRAVILQPLVSHDRKNKVVADAFQSRLGPTTLNFLYLLIRKRREDLIDTIIADFRRLTDERAGRVEAFVESATPLDNDQLERLRQAIQSRTGKIVLLRTSVDTEILGGLRVRIGDDIIDAGLRTRLNRLRQRLMAAR